MMRYTVIGLGQFGQELCTELSARNIEVVAVASTDEELEHYHSKVEERPALLPLDAATEYNALK